MRRLALVVAFGACGNGAPSGAGARDQVIATWKKSGLDVSSFATTTTDVGKDCAAGTVSKVDVLVCNFATPDAAKQAGDVGLQWIGDTTGSSQIRGTLLIVVADRHKTDPNGRTINQIFKVIPS